MAGPLAALAALLVAAGAAGPPPAGRYDARLCVTVSTQAPSCGPAEAHISAEGELRVQVNDIAYHLSFEQGTLLGVTTHHSSKPAPEMNFLLPPVPHSPVPDPFGFVFSGEHPNCEYR